MTIGNNLHVIPEGIRSASEDLWDALQKKSQFPLAVMMAVTGRCNESCPHCEATTDAHIQDEMSLDVIQSILSQLAAAGTLAITFTGGEPTLREDLCDIIAAASAEHFYVSLKTNASLLTDARVDALVSAGLSAVNISLYHDIPEAHDRFVGYPGSWQRVMASAERFHAAKVRTTLSLVAMNWNSDAVPRMITECERKQFSYMVDTHIAPRVDGNDAPLKYQASPEQLAPICSDPRILALDEIAKFPLPNPDRLVCGAGKGCCINYDGELMACSRLPVSYGSLLSNRFEDLWLKSRARKGLTDLRWRDLPVCSECRLSKYCPKCLGCSLAGGSEIQPPSPEECSYAKAVDMLLSSKYSEN